MRRIDGDPDRGLVASAPAVAHLVGEGVGADEARLGRIDDDALLDSRLAVLRLCEPVNGQLIAVGIHVVGSYIDVDRHVSRRFDVVVFRNWRRVHIANRD